MTNTERCTRQMPKALAPAGHVYEHGRCRQCGVTEPPAIGYGQPSAREALALDRLLYGMSVETAEGERVPPESVRYRDGMFFVEPQK